MGPRPIELIAPALFLAMLPAQEQDQAYPVLSYPEDAGRVVATVGGAPSTLEDLLAHIEERHSTDISFRTWLKENPHGYFTSPLLATWVRHFAYARALREEALYRKLDPTLADPHIEAALKAKFEAHLEAYSRSRAAQGSPFRPTEKRINRMLARYQRDHGLEAEVQGWLDFLVPGEYRDDEIAEYYRANARVFGGVIDMAHILVHTRDPGTGILLGSTGQKRAAGRQSDIEARLGRDGVSFKEIARMLSDDRTTADRGGLFSNVSRFDHRLPPEIIRAAWYIKDGDVVGPVDTPFGRHYVRRITFNMTQMILFSEAIVPQVREVMRRHRQEDLLLDTIEKRKVELKL